MITLAYNYHDANLSAASVGPRREVSLQFDLSPVIYPSSPSIRLRCGGIVNFQTVSQFIETLTADADDDLNAYLARCDLIEVDSRSYDGDVHVQAEFDYYGSVRIHCQHLTEIKA